MKEATKEDTNDNIGTFTAISFEGVITQSLNGYRKEYAAQKVTSIGEQIIHMNKKIK